MISHYFCKWPENNQAAATAYEAECTVQFLLLSGEVSTPENPVNWSDVRQDRHGNWTVAMYAPPWIFDVDPIEEPASCVPLRADAVIVENPEWDEG